MSSIRRAHKHSLVATIATVVSILPAVSSACSPPLLFDYDARLSMVVSPDQPGEMGQGATGRIDFSAELLSGPTPASAFVPLRIETLGPSDASQLLPGGALQPIRLTAAPDNSCPFYEQFGNGQFGATFFYTLVSTVTAQASQVQCSLRFEVLTAASQLRNLKFEAKGVWGGGSSNCYIFRDVNPADNTVAFPYGGATAIHAVSTGGRIGWWTMAIALAALAMGSAAARRRNSRRN